MKPAWDKLMKNWNKEPRIKTSLIGDVDCTAEGKPLCDQVGVEGYPTVKWGEAGNLQAYVGGRGYDDLKKWVKENLKPMCSPSNIDLCDDETKREIAELQKMSAEDLAAKIEEETAKLKAEVKAAEDTFTEEVNKLRDRNIQMEIDKDEAVATIKGSDFGIMEAVQAHARKGASKEEL